MREIRRENGNDQNNMVAEVSKFFTFVVLVVYGVDHQ